MEFIANINSPINSVVWGPPMLILLVGAGILLTCRTKGVQFRKLGYALRNTVGKVFKRTEAGEGEITPFQAMSTVICSLSGLSLLCAAYGAGIDLHYGIQGDTSMNAVALATVFGTKGGAIVIGVALSLFAFSTVLGWALYGTRCCEFLLGSKAIKPYQAIFVLVIVVGATMDLSLVWNIADTLNGLMAIPNLIALVGLSGVVVKETKRHFEEAKETT